MNRADAIKQQVVNFLVPEFTQKMPDGRTLNGLSENDFRMVVDGYACGECLAVFAHYTVRCPLCGTTRDVSADVQEAPQLWLDHLAERHASEPVAKQPNTIDDAIRGVMENADVTETGKPKRRPK